MHLVNTRDPPDENHPKSITPPEYVGFFCYVLFPGVFLIAVANWKYVSLLFVTSPLDVVNCTLFLMKAVDSGGA